MSASVQVLDGYSLLLRPQCLHGRGWGGEWAGGTSDWEADSEAERNVEMPGDGHSMHVGHGWMQCTSRSANGH